MCAKPGDQPSVHLTSLGRLKKIDQLRERNIAGENTFSEDVLKIEKCGPDEDYLTIIDVPGIFRTTTEGVTTNEDKELVRSMVKRYIKDNRTVILAVLPSNVDVATQEILSLAEEADRAGDRTLGILTKADLLTEQTAKAAVVSLVEGNRKPLKLGYHVVTNRGGDDLGEEADALAALGKREAMFLQHPWDSLPGDCVGISALRARLEDLLGEITDRAFPKLRAETRERLVKAEKKLKDLGAARQTEREQQQYLVSIASDFQALVRAALDADYSAHPAFARDELRLITAVANVTEQFSKDFSKFARTYIFQSEDDLKLWSYESDSSSSATEDDDRVLDLAASIVPDPAAFSDLDNIIVTDWSIKPPRKDIMTWIDDIYHRSRGLDLGTVGPGILRSAFQEQSTKWETMTMQYLSKIILLVHRFILTALEVVCRDAQVLQEVTSAILAVLCVKYEDSMKEASLLVNIERQFKPYTLNHYFNHNQQRSYGVRIKKALHPKARKESGSGASVVSLSVIADAITNKSNAEYAKENIHDTLKAYYKVAYKRFVDNVFMQVVNFRLLSSPSSPLRLFSETWVLDLSTEKLLAVAGESRRTREGRETLKKEIQDLEVAMQILR
ncbi:hypothetical protein ACRALDRAFT_1073466 [Sodiomyces alcalophilus JCM 7366]|uniref:uncharacterized protein n=1 Tax=Sodiomyces alcalophilus JCM 7366 TaxID=591952 RepID=UPI0039B48981